MQTHVVQIGNSLGVRLPKAVLVSLGLERASALQIEARGGSIVLKPVHAPRTGWADAFAAEPAPTEDLWEGLPADEAWDR